MIVWKDTTTYSRGDEERIPSIWRFDSNGFYMSVHKHIYYPKDQWLLSSNLFFDKYELKSKDIDDAKIEAEKLAYDKFKEIIKIFENNNVKIKRRSK